MPKIKIFQKEDTNLALLSRKQIRSILWNKYYSLYMNSYVFEGYPLDYQAKDYLLKRLWSEGSIACFVLSGSEGGAKFPKGIPVFVPFVPGYWNIYDWPTKVSLVNTRGVKFIPKGLREVDKDVVIGYAQRNKKSIRYIVETYIERMTDILMVIKTNLKVHKMPWLIIGTPEDEQKLKTLFKSLEQDEPELFTDSDSADKFKALVSGAPFIIDKLYQYYQNIENELREFLGFGNVGVGEKKEHLINAEVSANNAIIDANKECLVDTLKEFFERIKDVLGIDIQISLKEPKVVEMNENFDNTNEEDLKNA